MSLQPQNGPYFAQWNGPSTHNGPWLDWQDGQIYAKNPDSTLIEKMIAIARQFDAKVQGDDGEIYSGGGRSPRPATLSLGERVARWFGRFRPRRPVKIEHTPLPFGVGSRVRDTWGNEHTVIQVDPQAEHGLGVIRTRRADGTEHSHAMIAHGLIPVSRKDESQRH
jgi:hypothetical protein